MTNPKAITHGEMVAKLVKSPAEIGKTLTQEKIDLMHATFGICGEAGELLDAVKKHIVYDKELDIVNVIEELGDIEFYMEQARQRLGITREEVLMHNINKLNKRYAGLQYTDEAAQNRADKEGEEKPVRRFFGSESLQQEHSDVTNAAGIPSEGDGQEHSDIMKEISHG